ncbi:hypothetical protein [Vibrio cortegadensis]|uniref:hypothetical protein n=1 Tax=Vibrio cortegadensis TaxID=1328770 RepID=UPI00352E203C
MPRFDKPLEKVMCFEFLEQYDIYQLAGISQHLNHKQGADFNFQSSPKLTSERYKSEIVGYFKNASDMLGGLHNTPESKVRTIAYDVLSLSDMRFSTTKDTRLIIYIFTKIVTNNLIQHLPETPPNTITDINSMLNYLINAFISSQIQVEKKRELINSIIDEYYSSSEAFKFNWLDDKNDDQVAWVVDYFPQISSVKSIVAKLPNVMNINESHTKVVPAIFHSLDISDAEKKLIMMNFKRAWSQKKYREKTTRENKKTLNIVVDETVSIQLHQLSKQFDMPINQVITLMTNQFASKSEELMRSIDEDKKNKATQFSKLL